MISQNSPNISILVPIIFQSLDRKWMERGPIGTTSGSPEHVQTHVGVSQACHDGGNQHVQGVLDLAAGMAAQNEDRIDFVAGI